MSVCLSVCPLDLMDVKRFGIAGAGRAAAGEVGQVAWMDVVEIGFRF